MQFSWKTDMVEAWIAEKERALKTDDNPTDLSSVQALIVKQETFDAGLAAFEQEGVAKITGLKDQLVKADH
uniref:Uncharacterized protein n=1 Tax=Ciona savignyi TaxID=51511 RepID=H2YVH4_CIOSA